MRIGFVLYWCVFAFHLCKAEDVERTDSKEGRRSQWGSPTRGNSFVSDSVTATFNEQRCGSACGCRKSGLHCSLACCIVCSGSDCDNHPPLEED